MTHDTAVFSTSCRPTYAKRPPHRGLVRYKPTAYGRATLTGSAVPACCFCWDTLPLQRESPRGLEGERMEDLESVAHVAAEVQ
jgi:hypothetical protein